MKKAFLIILLLLSAIVVWFVVFRKRSNSDSGPKPQPIAVSQHSQAFNQSVQKMMNAYYNLTEGFVNWDTASVNKYSLELKSAIDSIQMNDLKKDSIIHQTAISYWDNSKMELANLIDKPSLDEKRISLNILSDNLYNFLRTVRFDNAKVYWQECPMAFNEDESGYWLSKTEAVRNPYLGTKHPKYGKGMLECGGPKDTLNFMAATSNLAQ